MIPSAYAPLANGTEWQVWFLRDSGERIATLSGGDRGGTGGKGGGPTLRAPGGDGPTGALYTEYFYANTSAGQQATGDGAVTFTYTQVLNNVGWFTITLPGSFDRNVLRKDNRVVFWRKPVGGAGAIAFMGLIRKVATRQDRGGNLSYVVEGRSLEYLLSGRVVAYYAGHSRASQTDQADDLLKSIVDENLGANSLTAGGRKASAAISSTYFSTQADAAAGPSVTKAFSYRNCLEVMRELADAARAAGTEVYFGMVITGENTFEFRTKTGQWGQDRTSDQANGLTFGPDYGNMGAAELVEDATEEINYVFGLGQGQGATREVQVSTDTTRTGASLWAVREGKIDARGESTAAAVLDAADALLVKGRPVTTFSAELLSVPGSVYGRDWNFGDRVTCAFAGRQFDALVRMVKVTVDERGLETIEPLVEALL